MRSLALFLAAAILFGCTAQKSSTTAPAQRIPANFDYTPPSRASVGATNMTIALLRPTFVGQVRPEFYVPPFNDMATSMGSDFQELLTAKGFSIRGPFGSRDEMTFNEKTTSDFALEVHIIINPLYTIHYNPITNWGSLLNASASSVQYTTKVDVSLVGYLEVNAKSPQYGELLWKKKINLEPMAFSYTGKLKWNGQPTIADELKQDNEVYNAMSRQLEKFYTQALNLSWQQIDPEEMKTIAVQARKADKKGS